MKFVFLVFTLLFLFNEHSFADIDPSRRDVTLDFGEHPEYTQLQVKDMFGSYDDVVQIDQAVKFSDSQTLQSHVESPKGSCSKGASKLECHFTFPGYEYFGLQGQQLSTSAADVEIQFSLDTKVVDGDDVAVPESLVGYVNVNGTKYQFQGAKYFREYRSYKCYEKLNEKHKKLLERLDQENKSGKISSNLRQLLEEITSDFNQQSSCQNWSEVLDKVEAFL